jgi:RHS repeat-associated protein
VNENETQPAYFDYFEITHKPNPQKLTVTSWAEYYAFGKVAKASCPANGAYRYGYQGEFAEKDQETDWNSFELRQYDSEIGRFTTTDPMGEFWSSYVGMGNNPVNLTDPTGGETSDKIYLDKNGNEIGRIQQEGADQYFKEDANGSFAFGDKCFNICSSLKGESFIGGFGSGFAAGAIDTWNFAKSLTTQEGWQQLGNGLINTAEIMSPLSVNGIIMRNSIALSTSSEIEDLPNKSAGEIGYGLGYVSEKVIETLITRKVLPFNKATAGTITINGHTRNIVTVKGASTTTTRISMDLKGKLGKMAKSRKTFLNNAKTKDRGTYLTRNFIIPLGRTFSIFHFQYLQQK